MKNLALRVLKNKNTNDASLFSKPRKANERGISGSRGENYEVSVGDWTKRDKKSKKWDGHVELKRLS